MTFSAVPKLLANTIMSEAELNRLPRMFKEIVQHQRDIERFCADDIVDFCTARNMLDRRAYLARCAHRLWYSEPQTTGSA